ncbi:MAG: fumarylacetoacetate hydrolase family protein, partial [Sulfurospirillaceae bacterium]|nr:fumarylacetoacetate hydrolase family protein [Sulfurospirillaceae bacterium]
KFVNINPNDIDRLSMELCINDQLIQEGNIGLMIYKPETMLAEISTFSTLIDNDIIMSGTPKGVGSFKKGDIFVGKIFLDSKEISCTKWIAQ